MNTLKSVKKKKNVYYNKIGNQFSMFIHEEFYRLLLKQHKFLIEE